MQSREAKLQYARDYTKDRTARRLSNGLCVVCGEPARTGLSNCQQCANDKALRTLERHRKDKEKAVEYLGWICTDCGLHSEYPEVYDFHHRDSKEKSMGITRMIRASKQWEKIREELDKCVLLCANCHRIRHAKEE